MREARTEPGAAASRAPAPGGAGPFPAWRVAAGALAVGAGGDLLLLGSEGPGLNLALLFLVLAGAVALVHGTEGNGARPSREAVAWYAVGLALALVFVLRASPVLHLLAFLGAAAAFAFPALAAGRGWLARSGVLHPVEAIGGAVLRAGLGPLRSWGTGGAEDPGGTARRPGRMIPAVLRGALIALPVLGVFGGLFMAADPEFSHRVTGLLGAVALEELFERIAFAGILAWLAFGYLAAVRLGSGVRGWIPAGTRTPTLGIGEVGTVLLLLNLLFLAFALLQLPALLGGAALVHTTPGLTYAGHAREGFGQLLAAAALVLPLLLSAEALLGLGSRRDLRIFRGLAALLLVLLGIVIASAFQRVYLYQAAYGLTEARFYGAAFLGWITLLCGWLGATVLAGRREHFAAPALVSGYLLLAFLALVNPDARIAQANLARLEVDPGSRGAVPFDAAYLSDLSADAVPVLVGALLNGAPDLVPLEARCTLAEALERRWGPIATVDWRSSRLADARARRLVARAADRAGGGLPGAVGCSGAREPPGEAEPRARTPGPGG